MSRKVRVGVCETIAGKKGKATHLPSLTQRLHEIPEVEWEIYSSPSMEISPKQVKGFDVVIAGSPKWTSRSVEGNKQLIGIIKASAGYDKLDVPALTKAGVMLVTIPEATRRPVAIAILTFILALSTRLLQKNQLVRENRWNERFDYPGYGLVGKTLGSIGVGHIGRELFSLIKPLGMKHIAYDPYINQKAVADIDVKLADLDTVLVESDFLNISCPLTETTYHLLGEKELKRMKRTAFLINTSRGAIIDEAALIKALESGWIHGAGLDVLEQEPPSPDNPLLKMGVDKVILSPHTLAGTDERTLNSEEQIIKKLKQIVNGQIPDGLINREVLDRRELQTKLASFRHIQKS